MFILWNRKKKYMLHLNRRVQKKIILNVWYSRNRFKILIALYATNKRCFLWVWKKFLPVSNLNLYYQRKCMNFPSNSLNDATFSFFEQRTDFSPFWILSQVKCGLPENGMMIENGKRNQTLKSSTWYNNGSVSFSNELILKGRGRGGMIYSTVT